MNTLNRIQAEQAIARKVAHEKVMAKTPWIRETIPAYRNATPEQIAKAQELLKKRGLI